MKTTPGTGKGCMKVGLVLKFASEQGRVSCRDRTSAARLDSLYKGDYGEHCDGGQISELEFHFGCQPWKCFRLKLANVERSCLNITL